MASTMPAQGPVLMESEPGPSFCFDAFSSREPVPVSLENAFKDKIMPSLGGLNGRKFCRGLAARSGPKPCGAKAASTSPSRALGSKPDQTTGKIYAHES